MTYGTNILNHDFGGADHLRVALADPDSYLLLLFNSSDWEANRRSAADALASSALDAAGRWLSPIYALAGTYHVVASKFKSFSVVFPHLKVGI